MSASTACRILDLRVENLRNIRQLRLELNGASLSVLTGGNGAGKTTVLEAIYLMARRRTFRSRRVGPITTLGESWTRVRGTFVVGSDRRLAAEWVRNGSSKDETVGGASAGDIWPAVKLIGENAQVLLDGEPALRRRFLDLSVFHVEPLFGPSWKAFRRALAQRNAAIRQGDMRLAHWNSQFCETGERLTAYRAAFVRLWAEAFRSLSQSFVFLSEADLLFDQGWPERMTLAEALAGTAEGEQRAGYTLTGPGRAGFRLVRDGLPLVFSRGQAKVVVCLLQLAACEVGRRQGSTDPIWLVDDLDAELDRASSEKLWSLILQKAGQVIAAGVEVPTGLHSHLGIPDARLFHVEHGAAAILESSA